MLPRLPLPPGSCDPPRCFAMYPATSIATIGNIFLIRRRIKARPRRRILGDSSAHLFRAEDLPEHIVATADIRGFRRQDVVEQAATAELREKTTERFESGRRLRLFLESAEDRRRQRLSPGRRLSLADS